MCVLLREAGVPCDMTVSEGGRHTVTHNCKQYALNLAAMVGVDYASIQFVASHERDVTRMHYLTLAMDALHKKAGFGPDWSFAHDLGRAEDLAAAAIGIIAEHSHRGWQLDRSAQGSRTPSGQADGKFRFVRD
ncbi:hypothetical protein WJX72_008692 [[Myrmecia] bisecta]|uniref:Uncharacterized protein n=1 Tax=[Myrmecia] bisecta TaxID=41462 RepID=A0AAW1PBA3_9CHLO